MSIDEKLKSTRMPQDGRSEGNLSPSPITAPGACPIPELRRLFDIMESGTVPNWLEVMSAISAMVAFHTDCDSPSECSLGNYFCRSQK